MQLTFRQSCGPHNISISLLLMFSQRLHCAVKELIETHAIYNLQLSKRILRSVNCAMSGKEWKGNVVAMRAIYTLQLLWIVDCAVLSATCLYVERSAIAILNCKL